MSALRRFIAGAICPACQQMDTIFIREETERRVCECVRCGHLEVIERHPDSGTAPSAQDTVRIVDRDSG